MKRNFAIGVIGGGQLARMMIPPSLRLGIDFQVFSDDAQSSASLAQSVIGHFGDVDSVLEFASRVDVLTLDHEHVPLDILQRVRATGTAVNPAPEALSLAQNKIVARSSLEGLGIPQPRWVVIEADSRGGAAVDKVGGFPCIAKKPVGGYDGKGVRIIHSLDECSDWLAEGDVLVEELVSFSRELAQLSARRPSGDWKPWPLVETRQAGGVCNEVVAGVDGFDDSLSIKAREIAQSIADGVDVVGVLAVELFETPAGELLVNELAMRPHNSGHVFTELSLTSQFEQHLRAVADLPLGSTDFVAPYGVMTNVFGAVSGEGLSRAWESIPEAKIHNYQKEPRPGRKAGHVVVIGSDLDDVIKKARQARDIVQAAG
jgi:5-(carboxyamino)imidazole ribonucleotide synthase